MKLLLNKAHYPVTVLGPGTRAGIWTQGCTLACPGCISRDTWDADQRRTVEVSTVVDWLASLPDPLDGVTISGGEPFEQPDALGELLDGIATWRAGLPRPVDVLAYSGHTLGHLRRHFPELLRRCDAVITGRYVDRLNDRPPRWRGSSNQHLTALTELGRERYAHADDSDEEPAERMQVSVDGERLWMIGIPRRGDMDRLSQRLETAGVNMREASWRA